jgi:hypothetical protein
MCSSTMLSRPRHRLSRSIQNAALCALVAPSKAFYEATPRRLYADVRRERSRRVAIQRRNFGHADPPCAGRSMKPRGFVSSNTGRPSSCGITALTRTLTAASTICIRAFQKNASCRKVLHALRTRRRRSPPRGELLLSSCQADTLRMAAATRCIASDAHSVPCARHFEFMPQPTGSSYSLPP